MVYVRRSSARPYRRPYRKMSKGRKRFSTKKKFTKVNNRQRATIKGTVMPRDLYVKLPYRLTLTQQSVAANANANYAFLGNSLVPYPADYSLTLPSAGDIWASGVEEYAGFYNQYRVLGSSIKIQIATVTTSNLYRFVMVPCTTRTEASVGGGDNTVDDKITEMNALSYDQLCALPNAYSKLVGLASGGNSSAYFKMFRKTKSMIGCKDIKDNEDTLVDLPESTGAGGRICIGGKNSFFYYFRVVNAAGGVAQIFEAQIQIKLYCQLTGRQNWSQITVPE